MKMKEIALSANDVKRIISENEVNTFALRP